MRIIQFCESCGKRATHVDDRGFCELCNLKLMSGSNTSFTLIPASGARRVEPKPTLEELDREGYYDAA